MGRRAKTHRFLLNVYVFPGGRVDPADATTTPLAPLNPDIEKMLSHPAGMAHAVATAAVRETHEETGLVIGKKVSEPFQTKNKEWQAYYNEHVAPDLSHMEFVARAITPPYRTRRFDTRFFLMDAGHIQGDLHDTDRASGELLELHWLEIPDAHDLDLPNITRMILGEIEERLTLPKAAQDARAIPFVHFKGAAPIRDTL